MSKADINKLYDVIIIGAGPAGLSAAIYMARARYKVLVLEKEKIGGQITITNEIVNYPGIEKSSGSKLTESMKRQAEAFGAEFAIDEVTDMELKKDIKHIYTKKGQYDTLGIILAVGANPRKLGFPGEKEFQGRGVAYCATCDGEFFTGKSIFVVGGGFAAVEEGIFLTKYAKTITMIVREEDFTCAKAVSDQLKNYPQIAVKFQTEVESVSGEGILNHAVFRDNVSGETWEFSDENGFGMFIFAGYVPNTENLKGKVDLDGLGYILTDMNRKTSIDGVYAAGDVCVKNLRQVVTAVSDGAIAATALEKYVESLHDKLDIPQLQMKEADLGKLKETEETHKQSTQTDSEEGFISHEIREKLQLVFEKFQSKPIIKFYSDNSELAKEMQAFLEELKGLTDRFAVEFSVNEKEYLPCLEIFREGNIETGICFHGVPGGHEFNSFIMALYHVSQPQDTPPEDIEDVMLNINTKVNVKVMVSLSCTMCPDVVMATQRIAAYHKDVTAEMFDLQHYPELKEKYKIMSVPCMIVNDEKIVFGKKSMEEIVEILKN